jgi:hypothetical protein
MYDQALDPLYCQFVDLFEFLRVSPVVINVEL